VDKAIYHWSKKQVPADPDRFFSYKGLMFCRYEGRLSHEQRDSKKPHFAFYGNRAMTREQIRYHVGLMIKRKQWPAMTAA
jgi:hypothetical protein